jgi:hypothetical protein
MKKYPTFLVLSLFSSVLGLFSCNSGSDTTKSTNQTDTTSCNCDSLAIVEKYLASHKNKGLSLDGNQPFYFGMTTPRPPEKDSVDQMLDAYTHASFNIPNPKTSGKVHGFLLDSLDYNAIVKDAANYNTLSFYFGIRNFGEYKKKGALYTIVVVPVWKKTASGSRSPKPPANTLGYDFVDPCPGSPGCPKP